MPIEINGTGSIVGVDSLSTPAVTNAAGSASAPSITFTGDSNTGIYSPAADTIAFTEGGVESVRIDSSGRVGIGTTSPSAIVHANSGSASDVYFRSSNSLATSSLGTAADGSTYVYNSAAYPVTFSTNATERARIDSSGRLLVGTSSARSFLGLDNQIQVESVTNHGSLSLTTNRADAFGSFFSFLKSRGTTAGSMAAVQSGDQLGGILFTGTDGSNAVLGASIYAWVDGTPGTNDMPGRLVFSTTADGASSPTERVRVTSAGDIGVNLAGTPLAKVDIRQPASFAGCFVYKSDTGIQPVLSLRHDGATGSTSRTQIEFAGNATGTIGTITSTGTATAYNTSSDYRLKENVTAVTDGITRLQQLKPSRFNFIADPGNTVDGFIAHEVQLVVPEAITGEKDAIDEDGNPVYQGIDQSKLVPLLTAALQEAIGEIEALKARVAALESA